MGVSSGGDTWVGVQKTHEQFVSEVHDILGDDYEVRSTYVDSHTHVRMYHKICGTEYPVSPTSIVSNKRGCPACKGGVRKTHQQFVDQIESLTNGDYEVLDKYKNAATRILIKHNVCNRTFYVTPSSVMRRGLRCEHCTIERLRFERAKTQEQFVTEVKILADDEYTVIGTYVNSRTKITLRHNTCNRNFETTPGNFRRGRRCSHCFGKHKRSTEQYKQKVYELVGDEFIVIGEYINNKTPVTMFHTICGRKMDIHPSSFISNGSRCKYCARNVTKTSSEFQRELFRVHGFSYSVLGSYINSKTKVTVRHIECGHIWDVYPDNLLHYGCPKCRESHGERKIGEILTRFGVRYDIQYKFEDCRNVLPLPFDFAVLSDINGIWCLIEYDGIQHYVPSFGDKSFVDTQRNDKIKNQYCIDNNIRLIRIPYTEFDRIEEILSYELRDIINVESSSVV